MVGGTGSLLESMEELGRLGLKRGQLTGRRVGRCSLPLVISWVEQALFQ